MTNPTTASDPQIKESGLEQIHGHNLYWEQYGADQGEHVVLLHHGLGSTLSWKGQIPALVASGYRVFLHDRWGYGRSDPRPEFAARFLHQDAEETIKLLAALGIEKASFIGHSDGGSIALILANQYPSMVKKLVLVAAHIYIEPKMERGLRMIRRTMNTPLHKTVHEQEHDASYQNLVQAWIDCWGQHGPITIDLKTDLTGVRCPTLVIQGAQDEHATPKHAQDVARGIKNARLWLIPEVRHMPPHEIPAEFNQRVIQFLSDHEPSQVPVKDSVIERDNVQ